MKKTVLLYILLALLFGFFVGLSVPLAIAYAQKVVLLLCYKFVNMAFGIGHCEYYKL